MTCDITFDVSDENMALLHELADLTSEINKNLDRLFRVAELVAGAPKKEAALAVGAAQDGKEKTVQNQDTTVPARGQHGCGRRAPHSCLCATCRRYFSDVGSGHSCCYDHHAMICPVTACPDYLPEEVTKG